MSLLRIRPSGKMKAGLSAAMTLWCSWSSRRAHPPRERLRFRLLASTEATSREHLAEASVGAPHRTEQGHLTLG